MTIFRLNGVQLLKEPRLISTRYSLHPTEQVPVHRGRGSGHDGRDISAWVCAIYNSTSTPQRL